MIKKYSYKLFPKPLLALGYFLMVFAIVTLFLSFDTNLSDDIFKRIGFLLGFMLTGLIIVSFKATISIDTDSQNIFKEYRMIGMKLSKDKVHIPVDCKGLMIKQKLKQGTGYYKAVIEMNYDVKSSDMFFYSDRGFVRLINTDHARALKIAEFIKENLRIEYYIQK